MDEKGVFRVRHRESSFDESKEESVEKSQHRPPSFSSPSRPAAYGTMFWTFVALWKVVSFVCVALVVYWCTLYGGFAWSSDADLQFFVHPLLMVLGLILFYGDAIVVYRVFHFLPKWLLKWIHATLHLVAAVLSSVGLVAVFENHRRTGKADLYSLHSWVGLGAFSMFCLQFVGSFITFLFPGLSPTIRARVMPFHTFFGLGIFLLAVAAAEMGLTERLIWTSNYTSNQYVEKGVVGNCLGLFLIVYAGIVVYIATHSKYKRRALPSDVPAPAR